MRVCLGQLLRPPLIGAGTVTLTSVLSLRERKSSAKISLEPDWNNELIRAKHLRPGAAEPISTLAFTGTRVGTEVAKRGGL